MSHDNTPLTGTEEVDAGTASVPKRRIPSRKKLARITRDEDSAVTAETSGGELIFQQDTDIDIQSLSELVEDDTPAVLKPSISQNDESTRSYNDQNKNSRRQTTKGTNLASLLDSSSKYESTEEDMGEMGNPSSNYESPTGKQVVLKRGRKAKHNWEAIQRDFIQGVKRSEDADEDELVYPTLKQLSEKYDVPYQTMRDRSMKERWREKKDSFIVRNAASFHRSRAKRMKKRADEFDDLGLKAADTGIKLIMQRLVEIAQEADARKSVRSAYVEQLRQGITVDPKNLRSAVYYKEINELASALDRLHTVGQKALGIDKQTLELIGSLDVSETHETSIKVDITQELIRDDADRLGGLLGALGDAALLPKEIIEMIFEEGESENEPVVIEAAPRVEGDSGVQQS